MILQHSPSIAVVFFFAHPALLHAQGVHSDIRFDYDANQIDANQIDVKVNAATGARIGVGDFPLDSIFRQFEVNPGFASESDVGLGINPFDTIVYNVLDNLLFWNGAGCAPPDPSTQIRIENNGAPDTVVSSSSGAQPGEFSPPENVIGQADGSGEFHSHVDFFLEPNIAPDPPPLPEIGAYGLKLSLSTDAVGIADSDPFLIVFNFGLDSAGFETAVDHFAELLAPGLPGDMDRDGDVDFDDIDELVLGLSNPDQYASQQCVPAELNGDTDGDGDLDFDDIDGFVSFLTGGPIGSGPQAVPEPTSLFLAVVASAVCATLVAGQRRRMRSAFSRLSCPLQK